MTPEEKTLIQENAKRCREREKIKGQWEETGLLKDLNGIINDDTSKAFEGKSPVLILPFSDEFIIEEYDPMLALDYKFIYEDREKNLVTTKSCLGKFKDVISNYPEAKDIDISDYLEPVLFIIKTSEIKGKK